MEDSSFEQIRNNFRPDTIKVLFIGESPPSSGKTFFYKADSLLFEYTHKAFSIVYEGKCGQGTSFLQFFKSIGCYLEDLCLRPVNKRDDTIRHQQRIAGIDPLSDRIGSTNPLAFVIVMKGIAEDVGKAMRKAGFTRTPTYVLTFPAYSNSRKEEYVIGLDLVIKELRAEGILD